MRNKKGSMELSVNSIVILVIAIVLMGLILGFIRAKFAEVSGNLVTNEPDPTPASSEEPITLSRETVSTIPNGQAVLKVNVYNPTGAPLPNHHVNVTCTTSGLSVGTTARDLHLKSGEKTINLGEQAPFIMSLQVGKSVGRSSYLCSVFVEAQAGGGAIASIPMKDFVIQVN